MSTSKARLPIIVIGSGLAGLTASSSALKAGAQSVILLERAAKAGGNSIKASSGINGAPTKYQHGPEPDTSFFSDSVKSAGKRLLASATEQPQRENLISLLTNSSKAAIDFLVDEIGVDLSVVAPLGGHSVARTHRGAGKTPPGAAIIQTLLGKLKEDKRFELRTSCEVKKLLSFTDGSGHSIVTGVEYQRTNADDTTTLTGPVIFATGGFAGDAAGLLAQYRPDLTGMPSTNDPRPGMHALLTAVGARLVDMDSVQIHPTGFVDPANSGAKLKFLAAEVLRGEGGILLHQGRRFLNEMETREEVSNVIMGLSPVAGEHDGGDDVRQWDVQLLLDPGTCEATEGHVGFYVWKGLMVKKKVGDLDERTRDAVRQYCDVVAGEHTDPFGRVQFGHWSLRAPFKDDDEVCVGRVTPIVHFTMGGVVINEKSEVLASELGEDHQSTIRGLWAAGEVTGGIHGDNRLGGSSLLECVVFGSIAGGQAAAHEEKVLLW